MNAIDAVNQTADADGDLRIVYIAGMGRSGTTVLDQVLGAQAGYFSAGEVGQIWINGVLRDMLCACGQRFSSCAFWDKVRVADPALLTKEVATRMNKYHEVVLRSRSMYQLWCRGGRSRLSSEAPSGYFDHIARLYRAISRAAGGQVIVDSSKHPTYAFLLLSSGISRSIEIVHMVRDPRAVAYSWMRHKVDPGVPGRTTYMNRYRPTESAMLWLEWNRASEKVARTCGVAYCLLRYEDFVEDVDGSLSQIGVSATRRPEGESLRRWSVPRPLLHTLSGNPSRLDSGPIQLRRDDEWRTRMRMTDALTVSLISSPALRRYGYRFHVGSGAPAE
jgi:Sulfotransferase family